MNNELSTFNSMKLTNKLRSILGEYKGMVLDEGLLKKLDVICRNIETELKLESSLFIFMHNLYFSRI